MDNVENQIQGTDTCSGAAATFNPKEGQDLAAGTAAVSFAYPSADPVQVRRNTIEINADVAKASQPKLVRHLMQQRIDEAQFEAKRLQHLLDTSDPALLDCTVDAAMKIFG